MSADALMVSVSGIRGKVGSTFTPEVATKYTAAYGAWALSGGGSRAVVLGRDSRISGPQFHEIVRTTLESAGVDVIDIGLTTTPTLQLAVEHHHAAGGICITASHNPIEWNALKFVGPDGLFLSAEQGKAMRVFLDGGEPAARARGTTHRDEAAILRHLDLVLALPQIDVTAIRAKRFRVAYDACRGSGGAVMPILFERLGCQVTAINTETDGRFPRPPEPVPENLGDLERLTRESGAQVGIATDPDVDRLAIVSDEGKAIGEDYTLAFACRVALRHRKGHVVTNLSTSRVVDDAVAAGGGTLVRAPVGEVNVALRMRDTSAVVGGEGNGGVIIPELHLGRDAPLAAALVLQMLSDDPRPISRVVADAPRYSIIKDKLDRPATALDSVYRALTDAFPEAAKDTQDGLRLDWKDRWMHVRPSGTEPIVRVIAEAPTKDDARKLVEKGRSLLAALK